MTDATIQSTGYIIADDEGLIHGTGLTADLAWNDARETLRAARIDILTDDADSTDCLGSWTRESSLKVLPATETLMWRVEFHGGDQAWDLINGVACTRNEARDAR